MNFDQIYKRLENILSYRDFLKKDGLILYKALYSYLDINNRSQLKKIKSLSEKLEKILIDANKFSHALDIYNFEIDFFHNNYASERLTEAYKKSILLTSVIESISTRESYEITENFQNLIEHFENSTKSLQQRFKNLYNEITFEIEKRRNDFSEYTLSLIDENLNNLIIENEFHTNHFIYYLKDAYLKLGKMYKKIHFQALRDDLTKLNNRRHLYANYPTFIFLAKRQKLPISVILLDIDDFKIINDNYGHQKGDEILIMVAGIIENFVRKSDVIIRFGGDEFLMLLFDADSRTSMMIAESIRQEIENRKIKSNDQEFGISISAGISCRKPVDDLDDDIDINNYFEEMIKEADLAMYNAKYDINNKITIYNSDISTLIN